MVGPQRQGPDPRVTSFHFGGKLAEDNDGPRSLLPHQGKAVPNWLRGGVLGPTGCVVAGPVLNLTCERPVANPFRHVNEIDGWERFLMPQDEGPRGVMMPPSWAELLQQVGAGRLGSFEELHAQTHGFVLRIADAQIRDPSQAEEVAQEVFLEVWRTAARFDPVKGSAESWLRRLTHSRAVDRIRHAQASRVQDHLYAQHHILDDIDDVVSTVLARAAAAEVRLALSQLSLFQQQALLLTHVSGLTNARASELLGVPLPTLKSRIRQGLQMLRQQMTLPERD